MALGPRRAHEEKCALPIIFEGELFADYHQVYLADAAGDPDLPTVWSEEDVRCRIRLGESVLVVSTARNMDVPVRVELHEAEPQVDMASADHVAVGGFATSGEIVIAGLMDELDTAVRARVPPGPVVAMVVFTDLGMLGEDGLDGADRYAVHLWPDEAEGVSVPRQWDGE